MKRAIWRVAPFGDFAFRGHDQLMLGVAPDDTPLREGLLRQFDGAGWVSIKEVLKFVASDATDFHTGQVKKLALKPMEKAGLVEVDESTRKQRWAYPEGCKLRFGSPNFGHVADLGLFGLRSDSPKCPSEPRADRNGDAGGARISGGATRWLGGVTPGRLGTGGTDRSIADPTLSRSILGAGTRDNPGRRVRSRPRRAEEIRFVPVDIMGAEHRR